jgi:hypothetical protein
MERIIMTKNSSTQPLQQPPAPSPALKRLDRLVGTWCLKGRTLDSKDDNVSGRVTIEWLPGGFFLHQRGELDFRGLKIYRLEIIGYDPSTKTFPSHVYPNVSGVPLAYQWDIQGNIVTHWTKGSKYTGAFSEDGNILSGGWRPEEGTKNTQENTYDATMTRINQNNIKTRQHRLPAFAKR